MVAVLPYRVMGAGVNAAELVADGLIAAVELASLVAELKAISQIPRR